MSRRIITQRLGKVYPDDYYPEYEDDFSTKVPYKIEHEYIPEDPQEFYDDFGHFIHPFTGKTVPKLGRLSI